MFFDREGQEIGIDEWRELQLAAEYRIVAQDQAPSGFYVSTVWLGVDHSHGTTALPLIFETMVFKGDPLSDEEDCSSLDCQRYADQRHALLGHVEMISKWSPEWAEPCG